MFIIKNIKISLKVSEISLNSVLKEIQNNKDEKISYKVRNNYIIIRNKYVYILFKPKNSKIQHINITGIPNNEKIYDSIKNLTNNIWKSFNFDIIRHKIDNLTAVYDNKNQIDQMKILNRFQQTHVIRFNKEKFPGLFLTVQLGTFIIFHTGKVNLVGCKNADYLNILFKQLKVILD
jgi:TATA-box binding protein (TBP) (component of TFIID and TFIIIB)